MSSNNTEDNKGGEGEMTSSKVKGCTSCDQNSVDTITKGISNIAILNDMSTCACCGKEGNSDDMNTCNKCQLVKYCNAACKKKHRSKHKKACERRMAELHEEQLFKEVEPEDCPICFQPMPIDAGQTSFMICCGKDVCNGCIYDMEMSKEGKNKKGLLLCPYCRTPKAKNGQENIIRTQKLMEKGNAQGFNMLAGYYKQGKYGLPQDYQKTNELLLKAGELGYSGAYSNLGNSYHFGEGVEIDLKKAKYYYELAAVDGDTNARYNLGCIEGESGNVLRAYKYYMIAAKAGDKDAIDGVKEGYMNAAVTKNEYANTLRAYHERQKEMKSDSRDEAAAIAMMGLW